MKPALLFLLASVVLLVTVVYYVNFQNGRTAHESDDKPVAVKARTVAASKPAKHKVTVDIKFSQCYEMGFAGDGSVVCDAQGWFHSADGKRKIVVLACDKAYATCQLLGRTSSISRSSKILRATQNAKSPDWSALRSAAPNTKYASWFMPGLLTQSSPSA